MVVIFLSAKIASVLSEKIYDDGLCGPDQHATWT